MVVRVQGLITTSTGESTYFNPGVQEGQCLLQPKPQQRRAVGVRVIIIMPPAAMTMIAK